MKIKLLLDNIENKSIDEIISFVKFGDTILPLLPQIIEYYDKAIPLYKIINYYGEENDLSGEEDEQQVACIFPEHGGEDRHKSARYYRCDRDTGDQRESLYCFKCQQRRGAFLTSLYIERTNHEKWSMIDHFKFLESQGGVRFPRDIIGEFDPNTYYVFDQEDSGYKTKLIKLFKNAEMIRELRDVDKFAWLEAAENLMRGTEDV